MLRLWNYLLELLRARRMRLELTHNLHKIFQEMLYILGWMEEIKVGTGRLSLGLNCGEGECSSCVCVCVCVCVFVCESALFQDTGGMM